VCASVCARVSAREVLGHETVAEVAVVGMPDETWGERIAAIIRWKDPDRPPSVEDMKEFLGPRLAPYKIPRVFHAVEAIPKNAMGKVNKKTLLREIFG